MAWVSSARERSLPDPSVLDIIRFANSLAGHYPPWKDQAMRQESFTADRLSAYTDAVFAVIVTIMVLELDPPEEATLAALKPLWPVAVSYAVSYLFLAIIWTNHHYLMRFVGPPSLRLIWINFAHLFAVSLLPFVTAWVARTQLASTPVALYAMFFVCIDIAYNIFEHTILAQADPASLPKPARRLARHRSLTVLAIFAAAVFVALVAPRLAVALICAALLLHLRPDVSPVRA